MIILKAGDIIFVRGSSPLSKIVRYFDKGRFSHVAIAVSETHIFEADWYTRATIREFHFQDNEYEIVDLGLTKEERDVIVHHSINLVGKWYDFPQIAWYIGKKLMNLKGRNKLNSPNMLICSEAVYLFLEETGRIPCANDLNVDVTPNELYRQLTHLKKKADN